MVDVAMLDCQVALLENALARYNATGELPTPIGNRHPSVAPFETFDTRDGIIFIAAGNDALWRTFCQAAGLEALPSEPRFATNVLRVENYAALRPLIADAILEKTTGEWQGILDSAGIPNSPVNAIDQLLENPQVQAREMIIENEHPTAGRMRIPGIPVKMSASPGRIRRPAPLLGEHTAEVLGEMLGFTQEDIQQLAESGVI